MKKVINYIKRLGGVEVSSSERSHYFVLNKKTIRVSDHIGLNSSCNMNIIVTKSCYMIWNRTTGDIDSVKYDDVKVFLKHANLLAAVSLEAEKFDKLTTAHAIGNDGDTVLGVDKSYFSSKQLKQIQSYVTQVKKNKKS
jgi:hypothetical protein